MPGVETGTTSSPTPHNKPPPPPPPPPPPAQWNPGDEKSPPVSHSDPTGSGPPAPPVPNNHTSVDTASLDLFAKNMTALVTPLNNLMPTLKAVDVQPGAFYHADQIRTQINGPSGDAGLKSQYQKVIGDLVQTLTDLSTSATTMSGKYKDTEALNSTNATDLGNYFQIPQSDYSSMMTDSGASGSGGSPPPPSSPPPPPAGK